MTEPTGPGADRRARLTRQRMLGAAAELLGIARLAARFGHQRGDLLTPAHPGGQAGVDSQVGAVVAESLSGPRYMSIETAAEQILDSLARHREQSTIVWTEKGAPW